MKRKQRKQNWTPKIHYNQFWVPNEFGAMVFGHHIFTGQPRLSQWVIDHEVAHTHQYKDTGFWKYLYLYFRYNRKYGYWRNPFEIAANRHANKLYRYRWLRTGKWEKQFVGNTVGTFTRIVMWLSRVSPRFKRWFYHRSVKTYQLAKASGFLGPNILDFGELVERAEPRVKKILCPRCHVYFPANGKVAGHLCRWCDAEAA